MHISAPCVVSLTWRVEDAQGQLLDELADPVDFFYGGDDLLPKIEEALAGQHEGFDVRLNLEPEHAFGDYDATLVFFESCSIFDPAIATGMQFEGPPPGAVTPGLRTDAVYTVTDVYPEHVVLDGNHPLAGMALRLHVVVRGVRAATAAEIDSGSVEEPVLAVVKPTAAATSRLH